MFLFEASSPLAGAGDRLCQLIAANFPASSWSRQNDGECLMQFIWYRGRVGRTCVHEDACSLG